MLRAAGYVSLIVVRHDGAHIVKDSKLSPASTVAEKKVGER